MVSAERYADVLAAHLLADDIQSSLQPYQLLIPLQSAYLLTGRRQVIETRCNRPRLHGNISQLYQWIFLHECSLFGCKVI